MHATVSRGRNLDYSHNRNLSPTSLIMATQQSQYPSQQPTSVPASTVTSLGGSLSTRPSAATSTDAPNILNLAVRGLDSALWCDFRGTNGWSGWRSFGGSLNTAPVAACPVGGQHSIVSSSTPTACRPKRGSIPPTLTESVNYQLHRLRCIRSAQSQVPAKLTFLQSRPPANVSILQR
jgi:hypothetical protein